MGTAAETIAALEAAISAAAADLALEITANLVAATPVDTGHARANWIPSVGEPPSQEVDNAAAREAGIIEVAAFKLGDGMISITNNAPYIGRLIAGSSSQAAPGWDLAAIDQSVATVQARHDGVRLDVSDIRAAVSSQRGSYAASAVAAAYSPLGDE